MLNFRIDKKVFHHAGETGESKIERHSRIRRNHPFYGRVGNGFDLLAVFVATVAVASPFLEDFSFILEMVVIGVTIGALSYRAGANRRGLL